ncbi:high affinity 3',5'-cyclic-AMP phosphodiesterase 7A-like [Watersipora subatra]|uniref:high affinity 3',5'-cyclic-AMP phosphodiesterase 7A-like n=1 Tax=Watersipora subatra TaxID=2589382 RepID=UPI00355B16D7
MGLAPYDPASRRSTRVSTFAKNQSNIEEREDPKVDMIEQGVFKEMGNACYKSSPSQHRQSGKSASMRQKHRRTSLKRYNKIWDVEQIYDSLLDDFYNSQTKCILSKISDWSFDVIALEKASNGRALFHVIIKLFQHHNLINHFRLDVVKLMTFARLVEEGYRNNPYHNATHAADVTQAMHCYITQGKIAKHLTPLEVLISLVSAITHDLDHPAVNQKFLVDTNSPLASLYENESVLEKHHWRMAMAVLHQTGLFNHLPSAVRSQIEVEMKSLILATDMSRQQSFFDQLKTRMVDGTLDMGSYDDRHFILQIALKCADISNPCREWSVCKTWSERVCKEFFRQGDLERNLQLKVSPLCDRFTDDVPTIQTGFIKFCVEPLFIEFEKYLFPSSMLSEQLTNLTSNFQKWELIKTAKTTVRPADLTLPVRPVDLPLPVNISTTPVDLPSPTPSEDIDSGFSEEDDVVEIHPRRCSLPNLPLAKKCHLSRRPSLQDGPGNKRESKRMGIFRLLSAHLAHNNSVRNEKDKMLLSEILANLFSSNVLR